MTDSFLIFFRNEKIIGAYVADHILWDVVVHDTQNPSQVGYRYRARVIERMGHSPNYTVDIGTDRPGFLYSKEKLAGGQKVVVDVIRDGFAGKGPKLSLVETYAGKDTTPALMTAAPDPVLRALCAYQTQGVDVVCEMHAQSPPYKQAGARLVKKQEELWEIHPVLDDLAALTDKTVPSETGWSLIVEPLETLTVIDVNAGGAALDIKTINRDAGAEAMRQIRLRNLSGLILIDFLKNPKKGDQQGLLQSLRKAAKADPARVDILGFTHAGLLELTRQRRGLPLRERLKA